MGMELPKIDPTKQAFSFYEEFKAFAFKGNVIDMAVGVIIGGAFGKIIESLVKNVLMPFISAIAGGDPKNATKGLESLTAQVNGVDIPYGLFVAEVANFLILAAILFVFIVKILGWIMKSKQAAAAAPPPPAADVVLLTEIRDLLKAKA
jgi:large conductance mechanosensitive channel